MKHKCQTLFKPTRNPKGKGWILLYRTVFPVALVLGKVISFFQPKLRRYFKDRSLPWPTPSFEGPVLWFHCSSGEFEYAKPVIKELKRRRPEVCILVTYLSPSAKKMVENFPFVDLSLPCPFDRRELIKRFLDFYSPQALAVARTDYWPEMLHQVKRRQIPALLFATTTTATNRRNQPWSLPFTRWLLSHFDDIFCVSQLDKDNLREMGLTNPISITGDTRYDQVVARLERPVPSFIEKLSQVSGIVKRRVLVAGSTWPEDEAPLFAALDKLRKESSDLFVFVCPHEPTSSHLQNIEGLAQRYGLGICYLSKIEDHKDTSDGAPGNSQQDREKNAFANEFFSNTLPIVVVDRVGVLADLYRLTDFALVGGSFRKQVHSVMEPLAAGCLTLFGPYYQNSREALDFLQERTKDQLAPCAKVDTAEEMVTVLQEWSAKDLQGLSDEIQAMVRQRSGASALTVKWFERV